jgi:hypothetical protein
VTGTNREVEAVVAASFAARTAASRNTRFQAARYGLTWVGLAPTDRASFAWRLPSFDHLVGTQQE